MRFLFCLDLSLHAGAGKKFGILNFVTKHGLRIEFCPFRAGPFVPVDSDWCPFRAGPTPSFPVYKAYTHIKIQTFLSLTNNLTINFLFL